MISMTRLFTRLSSVEKKTFTEKSRRVQVASILARFLVVVISLSCAHAQQAARITVYGDQSGPRVNREIFSQFAEQLGSGIYGGLWVGPSSSIPNIHGYRKDVIDALRDLHVPAVRWPGGCYADQYHWRDGIGPREKRPVRYRRGGNDTNSVGTHEFMDFLDLIGAKAYLSADVGNATPQETVDWMEYMLAPRGTTLSNERAANGHPDPWQVPYLGIGNELWGCGGHMSAEHAADVINQYTTFLHASRGKPFMKIAAGADRGDYHWTETVMREAGPQIDGLALHFYTYLHHAGHEGVGTGYGEKGAAVGFDEKDWASTLAYTFGMDDLIAKHAAIMDKYDPEKRVWLAVDEWGAWYKPDGVHAASSLYQENTIRDALIAAINLNIFVKHADRVKLTAIAQMINVLQAMLLTDGPRMVKTPTYWVYEMYRPWQDATSLPIEVHSEDYAFGGEKMPEVSASAVRDKSGKIHIALTNQNPNLSVKLLLKINSSVPGSVTGRILTAPNIDSRNTFEHPDAVKPVVMQGITQTGDTLSLTLPPKSVSVLSL
ncbi:alpha-N-arabinofuranosidase [Edaphobacter sp. 12200R-103]|uniref:alpha-N-arabinofuranosidase n=1 Tax=Edaphobacter sp. 12200R-103 TaxID=2703788 RepID=UPI00192EBC2E|nr:alpha-L-arabinofuranosidase C-terminal domain-containing protein [Edaphobacter sp. 12200R-103]